MELTTEKVRSEQIADIVIQELSELGLIDKLPSATMDQIESESISLMDQVTRDVMAKVLAIQARGTEVTPSCPKCHGTCSGRPNQPRSLESRRGKVNFKTTVFRCEACRLDFFPSVSNSRV